MDNQDLHDGNLKYAHAHEAAGAEEAGEDPNALELSRAQGHEIYNRLYALKRPVHPDKGPVTPYGRMNGRVGRHVRLLEKFCPPPARVLEVGCGRGYLLDALEKAGYEVLGVEVAASLFERDLKRRPARLMGAEDIHQFGENSFDAVISNDVLEHLVDIEAVQDALENIVHVARKWVQVSMGTGRSPLFPQCLDLPVDDLHTVQMTPEEWRRMLSEYVDVRFKKTFGPSVFIGGAKEGAS